MTNILGHCPSAKQLHKMKLLFPFLLLLLACQHDAPTSGTAPVQPSITVTPPPAIPDSVPTDTLPPTKDQVDQTGSEMKASPPILDNTGTPSRPKPVPSTRPTDLAEHGFAEVNALDPSIRLDIRYATTDNFTKAKIYDCPRCLLRPEAAEAIVKAHKALQKKGLGLKMFDCYRPRPYQQRLWDKVPNADYVTPPVKGSMHSRGAAVDLTIVDAKGSELDMGTPYDFFGVAAHTDHTNLPAKVLNNRRLLRETLATVGFKGIRTEWWHFSFQGKNYPLSDYVWPCTK